MREKYPDTSYVGFEAKSPVFHNKKRPRLLSTKTVAKLQKKKHSHPTDSLVSANIVTKTSSVTRVNIVALSNSVTLANMNTGVTPANIMTTVTPANVVTQPSNVTQTNFENQSNTVTQSSTVIQPIIVTPVNITSQANGVIPANIVQISQPSSMIPGPSNNCAYKHLK